MPPKKQEQEVASYKACFVLPVLASAPQNAREALGKAVNMKKDINRDRIMEVLKEKGLEEHISEGRISEEGRRLIGEHMKMVGEEVVAKYSKPADPKKDAKKDSKKDSKKEEPAQEAEPPIEFSFQKNCNDFYFYLDYPENVSELQLFLDSEARVDIIVLVKDKISPGSRKPDLSLLDNQKSVQDLEHTLNATLCAPTAPDNSQQRSKNALQMCERLFSHRQKLPQDHALRGTVIVEVPFLNKVSSPEQNEENFLGALFERLSRCTLQKGQYEDWRSERKIVHMIAPIRQTIKKEVQVESNEKGKKGAKAEPVTEIVEEVIEKFYQDQPENVKSDLSAYHCAKQALLPSRDHPETKSVFNDVLQCCLKAVCAVRPAERQGKEEEVERISQRVQDRYEVRALNRATRESLTERVRQIVHPKDMSMVYPLHFEFAGVESSTSLMQLAHQSTVDLESLRIEYLIRKMQELANRECPNIKWDFTDRQHIEKLSADRITAMISKEMMKAPQFFTGHLDTEGIRMLVLSHTNPPGRVLHHNCIMDWRVLPDFQNWSDHFLHNEHNMSKTEFYRYPCDNAGSLSVKTKRMMPTDNSIIRVEKWNIGVKKMTILRVEKDDLSFGMAKNIDDASGTGKYVYWHNFDDQYSMRLFKETISQNKKKDTNKQAKEQPLKGEQNVSAGQANLNGEQEKPKEEGKEEAEKSKEEEKEAEDEQIVTTESVCTWVQKKEFYLLKVNDQGGEIIWPTDCPERCRTISQTGQVTRHQKDGTITILDPNGDTSFFRNGKWRRIRNNNFVHASGAETAAQFQELIEGETVIRIRQDQTIFIAMPNKDRHTIFSDGTEMYLHEKIKRVDIKSPFKAGPLFRIHLARTYDLNQIGHGSAFAYLGFTNILERSYDGYMFEAIDRDLSINQFTERFEKDGRILEQKVRLIAHKDSSLVKINTDSATIVFNSPNKDKVLTEQYLNERWLQAFTPPKHHQQMEAGIFDVDLNKGEIENKDEESNKFVIKVDDKSEAHIAVSFVSADGEEDDDDSPVTQKEGFHVKEENYFLPPPNNRIPPRLFVLMPDGSGVEYLNSEQMEHLRGFTVNEERLSHKLVKQFTKQKGSEGEYLVLNYTERVNLGQFGLPDRLKAPHTQEGLVPLSFCGLRHCVIETFNWSSSFENILSLECKILQEKQQRQRKIASLKV